MNNSNYKSHQEEISQKIINENGEKIIDLNNLKEDIKELIEEGKTKNRTEYKGHVFSYKFEDTNANGEKILSNTSVGYAAKNVSNNERFNSISIRGCSKNISTGKSSKNISLEKLSRNIGTGNGTINSSFGSSSQNVNEGEFSRNSSLSILCLILFSKVVNTKSVFSLAIFNSVSTAVWIISLISEYVFIPSIAIKRPTIPKIQVNLDEIIFLEISAISYARIFFSESEYKSSRFFLGGGFFFSTFGGIFSSWAIFL